MTKQEATEILMKAVTIAQSKGVFNLGEARVVADAVDTFNPTPATIEPESDPAPLPPATDESVQPEATA